MSKHQESYTFDHAVSECETILEKLFSVLGWKVKERSELRFVVKEPRVNLLAPMQTVLGDPATIEITLLAESPNRTRITFYGHNFGGGPLQTGRIKKAISIIRERMDFATQKITEIKTEINSAVEAGLLCPTCGKTLSPGTKFCPNDGTRITKTCAKCGHANAPAPHSARIADRRYRIQR